MNRPTFERYTEKPLDVARHYLRESELVFNGLSKRIKRNRRHYALESAHIDARKSSRDFRSAKYVPMANPAVQGQVNQMLDVFRMGDPTIKAIPNMAYNYDPEMKAIMDEHANIVEDYYNRMIDPEFADFYQEVEDFLIFAAVDPYAVMMVEPEFHYRDVDVIQEVPIMLGGIPIDYEYKYIQIPDQLYAVYPKFKSVPIEDCRLDMYRRNWRDWRYYYHLEDISEDELIATASDRGWNMNAVDRAIEDGKYKASGITKHIQYGTVSPDIEFGDSGGTFRKVTGYIRLYDRNEGRMAIRRLCWLDSDAEDTDLLYEEQYPYSTRDGNFIVSTSYVLPKEVAGMSTMDMTASMQDIGNEAINQAWDAGESAPIVVSPYLRGSLLWRPREKWVLDEGSNVGPRDAVNQLQPVHNESMMVAMWGSMEQRINNTSGALDVITGANYSRERKKETLGKEMMRSEAANKHLGRIMARHSERLKILINHAWQQTKVELINMYQGGNYIYASPEIKAMFESPEIVAMDMTLSMPHIRNFVSKSDEAEKMLGLYDMFALRDPLFAQTHPRGIEELRRRVLEASDVKNVNSIIEADEEMQENINQAGGLSSPGGLINNMEAG